MSLTTRFDQFLKDMPDTESLDSNHKPLRQDPKRADFLLNGGRIVAEIKTLKNDPSYKGADVVNGYLRNTGTRPYGQFSLSRIAKRDTRLQSLEEAIYRRMTRTIEKICSSADKQIYSTASELPVRATGVLIILNDSVPNMHPRLVADRIVEFTRARPTNIHYCLLVFETHKVFLNGSACHYPFLIDMSYSSRQRRSAPFLRNVQSEWVKLNGYPSAISYAEQVRYLDCHPNSIVFGG